MANIEPTINIHEPIRKKNRKLYHRRSDMDNTDKPKVKPTIRKKPKHVKESHVKPELDKRSN